MGVMIYVPLDLAVTNDGDQDIWEIATPTGDKAILHGWRLYSPKTAAESVNLRLLRRSTTGNGGTSVEVKARESDGTTITLAVETLGTIPGTAGAIIQEFEWEQLGPLGEVYTPEMRIEMDVSSFLCLNLQTVLGATTQWKGWLAVEQV